jgi:hypothetical protein
MDAPGEMLALSPISIPMRPSRKQLRLITELFPIEIFLPVKKQPE